MAIVTFLSDFGEKDHYVSAVKGKILSFNPNLTIIDVSHQVRPFDIGHAAFLLKNSFRNFPIGTVHLLAIEPQQNQNSRVIVAKIENHLFVGCDTGIFSLISDDITAIKIEILAKNTSFIARDQLAGLAAELAMGKNLYEMGRVISDDLRLIGRQPRLSKREILGHVVHIDHYGNLITNIPSKEFNEINKLNNETGFSIHFGREIAKEIQNSFQSVEDGECFVLFNSDGWLEIGVAKGNAAELFGLRLDTPISIKFDL